MGAVPFQDAKWRLNAQARHTQTAFVAEVSHELQTPVTSILGFLEMLQSGAAGPLTHSEEEFLGRIHHSTERISALAQDLLGLASVEYARPHKEHRPVDLGVVVATIHKTLEPAIAARGLDVTFETPGEPVMVLGSLGELESLVRNLLSNPIKYTADGGWVRCRLCTAPGTARLEVRQRPRHPARGAA